MSSTSSSLSPPPSLTPSPPPSPPPSHPPAPPPSPQSTPLLASSPESPEDTIDTISILSAQAGSHLSDSEETDEFYESALALMQVLNIIHDFIDQLSPNQRETLLQYGTYRGQKMLNVLAAKIFSIHIQLCTAFSELGMWELVGARVSYALDFAEMTRGRFHVSEEAREWLWQFVSELLLIALRGISMDRAHRK